MLPNETSSLREITLALEERIEVQLGNVFPKPLRSLRASRKFASYPQSLRKLVTAPKSTVKVFPETPSVATRFAQVCILPSVTS